MIAGVCGGLAQLFGLPTAVVRLAFVLGTFLSSGFAIVIYIVLWIVMPLDDERPRVRRRNGAPPERHDPEIERELGED